jgi:hypothetical protein
MVRGEALMRLCPGGPIIQLDWFEPRRVRGHVIDGGRFTTIVAEIGVGDSPPLSHRREFQLEAGDTVFFALYRTHGEGERMSFLLQYLPRGDQ